MGGGDQYDCSGGVCRRVGAEETATGNKLRLAVYDVGTNYVLLEWSSAGSGFDSFEVDMLESGSSEWKELSRSLRGPFMKKKGLNKASMYSFRVRGCHQSTGGFGEFSAVLNVETLSDEMDKPTEIEVVSKEPMEISGSDLPKNKMKIQWKAPLSVKMKNVEVYALEYRKMSETAKEWAIASDKIKNPVVVKKNIPIGNDWVFRVRAKTSGEGKWGPWSSPSSPVETVVLQQAYVNMLGNDNTTLVRGGPSLTPVYPSVLAGKIIGLYFSAHWCPPCRQFTPMLAQFYNSLKAGGYPFEVIFVSADRDEGSFREYFNEMPWLAITYSSPRRQTIQAGYQVNGIPHLKIFGPKGNLISNNAVQEQLNLSTFQRWQSMA